ncbi:trans-sialidase [Trypanosoma rangeli]|uniref:Trans-sialidase n=1 Tax=Trypanosoma rangeli TaxID=5698 RepID=A0A422MV10_TRYRA|nr:trans-sialidase [Trypanosoma rangeli]RNE97019.1 trans-sialidase [Trypanosoma rangeli]|eukprot:RNE97019.1 trans-sialidase [Trypanosoma rangeli]
MSRPPLYSAALLLLFALICSSSWAVLAEANVGSSISGTAGGSPGAAPAASLRLPVTSITVPSVVEVDGEVVIIAQANDEDDNKALLAELVKSVASRALWALPDSDGKNSVMQDVVKMPRDVAEAGFYNPTPVVKGSKIYLLFQSEGNSAGGGEGAIPMYPWLLVGKIEEKKEGQETKTISWEAPTFKSGLSPTLEEKSFQFFSVGGGAGIVTKNGTLVFPAKAVTKEGKEVSLIMYSSGPEEGWRLSQGMTAGDCVDPAVVEWGSGKLLMMTACEEGHRKVYESSDMGKTWTEALGTLSRVWGNSLEREGSGGQSGFITATIEERDVMLLTLPVASNDGVSDQLHLWLTDAAHIVDVGPISDANKQVAGSALLLKGGKELISLQELRSREGDGVGMSEGLYLANLREQLEQIKKVVKTWKDVDERVKQVCLSTGVHAAASLGAGCSAPVPTEGLVGYLSGSFADSQWKDEYLGVNATVQGAAERAERGVKFSGGASGAKWPVSKQGQHQRYHFASRNFTLVATVTIGEVPTRDRSIPLMGARLGGEGEERILLGISYIGNRWEVAFNGMKKTMQETYWKPNTPYQVTLMLQDGNKGYVYVDGVPLATAETSSTTAAELGEVSHFYFGGNGDGEEGTDSGERQLTVANVLLYNRLLRPGELRGRLSEESEAGWDRASSKSGGDFFDDVKNVFYGAMRRSNGGDGSAFENASLMLMLLLGLWGYLALC